MGRMVGRAAALAIGPTNGRTTGHATNRTVELSTEHVQKDSEVEDPADPDPGTCLRYCFFFA